MRQTPPAAAPAAPPPTTAARTGRGGGTHATSTEKSRGFDQLVERLADARDDAPDARGSRASIATREDASVEARGTEPRAKDKDDADPAAAPVSDPTPPTAPQTPFPWTLPLNPALWTLEPDAGGDADAGQQTDDAAANATVKAASVVAVGAGIGATQVADALSVSLTSSATAGQGVPRAGAGDATEDGAATFGAIVDQRAAGEIGASLTPMVAEAPADAQAELGVGATFTTHVNEDINGVGVGAGEAGRVPAAGASAGDVLSLTASLEAKAGGRATAAVDGSQTAATRGAGTNQLAGDATANANADTIAAADAAAGAAGQAQADAIGGVQTDATAGARTDATTGVDRARQQAMQELWRAMARAQGGNAAAADGQGSIDGSVAAQGTIATDAVAAATTVTDRDTGIDASAASLAGDAVAAQAQETGPRANKASKADQAIDGDGDAWAAAAAAAAGASAAHASGQSADGSTNGRGANGRGRDAHPENFGGLVSSLRHASDGGVQGLSPAFEARSLMASAIDAGLDAHEASATAASATIVTTAPPDEQAAQIVRSMRLHWRGSVGEAQLRLTPEHLGQVLVSVKVDQGSVTATMHAETPAAQQWIQAHQQQLRDALGAQGLRVEQLQVTTDPEDRPRRDQPQEQERPRGRAQTRARDGNAPRFEIRM